MWLRLVWQLWAGKTQKDIMREIFAEEDLLPHQAYSLMKRALAPIFNAPEEKLIFLGLDRPETATELARIVAASIDAEEDRALKLYNAYEGEDKNAENPAADSRQLTL